MICSGLNAFLTIDYPLFLIRQSNTRTGSVFGGQVTDLCGLQLYGGTVDYHVGEVSYNLVGVHITTAGFDIRRLQDRVAYFANGLDLDMATLPVPEPSVPAAD